LPAALHSLPVVGLIAKRVSSLGTYIHYVLRRRKVQPERLNVLPVGYFDSGSVR
jgi:hypothetical protein